MESLTKGEQTRQFILDSAYQLFSAQGFHGTSMRQISDKSNITLGGIYNHFNSKEELFEAVLISFHPLTTIIPILEDSDEESVEEYIRNTGNLIYNNLQSRKEFFNLFFIEFVEFKGLHIPKLFSQLFPKGLELVKKISTKKGTTKDIPPQQILLSFAGMLFVSFGYQGLVGINNQSGYAPVDFNTLLNIILYGIMEENNGDK